MNIYDLYNKIRSGFLNLPGVQELLDDEITVKADLHPERTLMPEGDVPSEAGRPEYRVFAEYKGVIGEAYAEAANINSVNSSSAVLYSGSLKKVLDIPASDNGISPVTIASINAVMCYLNLCPGSFPDDPQIREKYAQSLCEHVVSEHGKKNIILVGYDGYIVKKFMDEGLDFWTMDKDPDNITKDRFHHVIVNSGKYNREACFAWGKVFIITGSTLCNGTIVQYLDKGKDLLFYGITCSGTAALLGLPWHSV